MRQNDYNDVVWSMGLSVQQVKKEFEIGFGSTIDNFPESVYLAGADLGGTKIENHARCIERSNQMLKLLNNTVDILRTRPRTVWHCRRTFSRIQKRKFNFAIR